MRGNIELPEWFWWLLGTAALVVSVLWLQACATTIANFVVNYF